MRWKYLVPRIVIVGLVWSFFVWAFDPILRWSLVKTGQKMNGAKVDVLGLKTQFFPPAVELSGVQIADKGKPGRNLVEFETFRLQLAGSAGPSKAGDRRGHNHRADVEHRKARLRTVGRR